MGKFKDLTGQRFGRLTVKHLLFKKNSRFYWLCICDCGNECVRQSYLLKNKKTKTKSCGCYVYEFAKSRKVYNEIIEHDDCIEIIINDSSALVDKEDYPKVKDYHWRIHKNYAVTKVYSNSKSKSLWMHKVIMGNFDKGFDIDHINRNPLDNRKPNLRVVTHYQNKQNLGLNKNNSSGYRNISFDNKTGLYQASFCYKYKRYSVGMYKSLETAIQKLNAKRKRVMSEEDFKIYEDSLSF